MEEVDGLPCAAVSVLFSSVLLVPLCSVASWAGLARRVDERHQVLDVPGIDLGDLARATWATCNAGQLAERCLRRRKPKGTLGGVSRMRR